MDSLTYYELLEIEQSASKDEIKRAYFRKIRVYSNEKHPEEFKQLTKAYNELTNDESRAQYDRSIQNNGEYDRLLEQVWNYKNEQRYKEATELLNKILVKYPDSADAHYHLADCYFELGWFDDAKGIIQELIFEYPSVTDYHFLLFLIYREQQEYSKAIVQANKLIKLQPQSSHPYRHLSDIYISLEQYDNAIQALERRLSNCVPALEDMPLLIDLLYLTNGMDKEEYCKRVGERIKRVPKSDEEKQAVINMLLQEVNDIDITHYCLPRIIKLLREMSNKEDVELQGYLQEIESQLPVNNYNQVNQNYNSQTTYNDSNEVAATENSSSVSQGSYESRGNIIVAIIVGIIFSFIGTPIVGILAGFVYYFFAQAIWNMIGCLFLIIVAIVILGLMFK